MKPLDRKVHQATILQFLEQIEICNAQIKKYLQIGEKEDSLPIRQEKHLKNQYLRKLDAILSSVKQVMLNMLKLQSLMQKVLHL